VGAEISLSVEEKIARHRLMLTTTAAARPNAPVPARVRTLILMDHAWHLAYGRALAASPFRVNTGTREAKKTIAPPMVANNLQ